MRPHLEHFAQCWSPSYRKDVIKLEKYAQEIHQDVNWTCGLELQGEAGTFFFSVKDDLIEMHKTTKEHE